MNEILIPRVDRRHRGEHSTACKCPSPVYIRPGHFKPLSREHGRALRNLMNRDKSTGEWVIRRRVSADPLFVFLRAAAGRKRAFRSERRKLLDALFILFINKVDLGTSIVTINIGRLAIELSPRDANGNIITEQAVSTSRISRLITELERFGIIECPKNEWDYANGCRFPKHVILTETGWQLTGINMDKLRVEQAERLQAIQDGQLEAGESISLKAARRRWYERCRRQTILSRRARAIEGKIRTRLAELPFDERKRQVAERLWRSLQSQAYLLTSGQFEKMVWAQLYQLQLVELSPLGKSPPR
ncbi:replication initiator protein RepA [Enterobacter sp. JGM127]|nr:replication initiator protein RepA [Enterobacter sp. JGM127]